MEEKKKIITVLIFINVILLCCIGVQIAAAVRDSADSVAASVSSMLEREVKLRDGVDGVYTLETEAPVPLDGRVLFQAADDRGLRTNYAGQVFRKLADAYFSEGEISWEQTEAWSLPAWQLIVRYPAWEGQSLEEFCGYLGEFAEFCMESDVFLRDGHVVNEFPAIDIQMEGNAAVNEFRYSIYGYPGYTREDFERELYEFLYLHSPETLEARIEQEHQEWLEESRSHIEENMASYLEMEPDAACKLENGREYRMLVTDYVMGDCFYILLGVEADGASAFLLNPDPFNQEMGYVQWMVFIDETLGFACLSEDAGESGDLYRTTDGGKSFEMTEWPRVEGFMEDGTVIYPFDFAEKLYEERERLYLLVNQGATKSYQNQNGVSPKALFASDDQGESWNFVKEIS